MKLTENQKLALAQRIFDEFGAFVNDELQYQVDSMKDNDELSWEYHLLEDDAEDITKLVKDLVGVPPA